MTKKAIKIIFDILVIAVSFYALTFIPVGNISVTIKLILMMIIFAIFGLNLVFKLYNKTKCSRLFYTLFIISSFLIVGYILLNHYGFLDVFSSANKLKEYILSTKEKGVIIYILIQCGQVILLPIPAAIICIVGSMIYGPILGGIYCSIGVLIGSYISFILGKTFGYKLVAWVVGKDNADKYSLEIRRRGGFFLILAFLLPMFPDDILCIIAGITNMSFKNFFWITLITRPIGVICMSFFGGGHIIPFSGWGLYIWIIILFIAIISIYITYKYQDKLQNYILRKLSKKKIK